MIKLTGQQMTGRKAWGTGICWMVISAALGAQTADPLTAIVRTRFDRIRADLEEAADLMPAEKYSFRLTDGQRTFGEWIGHAVSGNYSYCSDMRAQKPPAAAGQVRHLKAKAELSQALEESFLYCAEAMKDMTDQRALTAGAGGGAPVRGMVNLVSSQNEHYGNMVGYLRANNLVPPSTARAQRQKK